jgi:hypothetical protein
VTTEDFSIKLFIWTDHDRWCEMDLFRAVIMNEILRNLLSAQVVTRREPNPVGTAKKTT